MPSVASRPPTLSALSPRRTRSSSTAASMSPPVSARAFLQSIMPAPVRSRSSLTCDAEMAAHYCVSSVSFGRLCGGLVGRLLAARRALFFSGLGSRGGLRLGGAAPRARRRAPRAPRRRPRLGASAARRLGLGGRRLGLGGGRLGLGGAAPRPARRLGAARSARARRGASAAAAAGAPGLGGRRRPGLGRGGPARRAASARGGASARGSRRPAASAAGASAASPRLGLGGGALRGLGRGALLRLAASLLLGLAAGALLGLAAGLLLGLSARLLLLGRKRARPSATTSPIARVISVAGADRVVVARHDVVDPVGVAVGVDEPDDRDPQALRLADRDRLGLEVDHEHRVGHALHVLDAAEVRLELLEVGLGGQALARRQQRELALGRVALEVVQALDAQRDRLEVGQQAAEPAVVDVRHAGRLGDLLDAVAGLLLGADEQHGAAAVGDLGRELLRLREQRLGLEQIDDVDPAALAVDEAAHLRVPTACLVAEVDAGLQQLSDSYLSHGNSLDWL